MIFFRISFLDTIFKIGHYATKLLNTVTVLSNEQAYSIGTHLIFREFGPGLSERFIAVAPPYHELGNHGVIVY